MADKEETPYIDYSGASSGSYEGKDLTKYFRDKLAKHNISWLPTIKEKSLAKRMVGEYGNDVEGLVDYWINVHVYKAAAANFVNFYQSRHELAEKATPKDYGWNYDQ